MTTHINGLPNARRILHPAYVMDEREPWEEGRLLCFVGAALGTGGGRRRRAEGGDEGGGDDFSEMATPFMAYSGVESGVERATG